MTRRSLVVRTIVRAALLVVVVLGAARIAWLEGSAPAATVAAIGVLYILGRILAAEVSTWTR